MARKAKKRRANRKEEEEEEEPEEVTLGQGREEAEKLKKEEKESQRRVAAEAKSRRRLRSGPKNPDVQDIKTDTHEVIDDVLTSPLKQAVSEQKHVSLNAPLKLANGLDQDPNIGQEIQNNQLDRCSTFLDDNVVQYLTTREKRTHTTISDAQDNEKGSKPKILRKKLHQDVLAGDGANRVELLMNNKKSISYHAQTAVEFRRDQLYGTRVRRSHAMLAKLYRIPAKAS